MGILYPDHPQPQHGALTSHYHMQVPQHLYMSNTSIFKKGRTGIPRHNKQKTRSQIDVAQPSSTKQASTEHAATSKSAVEGSRYAGEQQQREISDPVLSMWSDMEKPQVARTTDRYLTSTESEVMNEISRQAKSATSTRAREYSPKYSSQRRRENFDDISAGQRDSRRCRASQRHKRERNAVPQSPSTSSPTSRNQDIVASIKRQQGFKDAHDQTKYSSSDLPWSRHPRSSTDASAVSSDEYGQNYNSILEQNGTGRHSVWDEVEFYKREHLPEQYPERRGCFCTRWSRKKKWIVFGSLTALVVMTVLIATGIVLSRKNRDRDLSTVEVTNPKAFATGGATHKNPTDVKDGIGAGMDEYHYYSGTASNFPSFKDWVSFEDMWNNNLNTLQHSCGWLHEGQDNSPEVIQDIYNGIQNRAEVSLVDHRLILAIILQESSGCVYAGATTSSGGVNNPGLMQSHNGQSYNPSQSSFSILEMIQDGTQGTQSGDGLVQYLDQYGNPYDAARGYNSGHISKSGNLSAAAGATACYVSDIANRLTGWVSAPSTCPNST